MSITRIGEFQARPDQADALRQQIASFIPMIRGSPGCQSCQALQSEDDPTRFMIIEVWDSVEAHQASVKQIPPELLAATMQLLASVPKGGYYRSMATA